jgi:hypothetical protein
MSSPLTAGDALDLVDGWLARPNTVVVHPTERHSAVLRELLAPLATAGNLVTDAHLAAIAINRSASRRLTRRQARAARRDPLPGDDTSGDPRNRNALTRCDERRVRIEDVRSHDHLRE